MPLFPRPSLQPPEAIKPSAYFSSETFLTSAAADVLNLLEAYEAAQLQVAREVAAAGPEETEDGDAKKSAKGKGKAHDGEGKETVPSPFVTFKQVYERKGWALVHLAVVDPALRKEWFDSLTRLILAYVDPKESPLRQIGALFAAYTVWGTQPAALGPKYNLRVSLDQHEHIVRLPELLAPTLDDLASDPSLSFLVDAPVEAPAAVPAAANGGTTEGDIEIDPVLLQTLDSIPTSAAPPVAPPAPAENSPSNASSPLTPASDISLAPLSSSRSRGILPSHALYEIVSSLISSHAFVILPNALGPAGRDPRQPTTKLVSDAWGLAAVKAADKAFGTPATGVVGLEDTNRLPLLGGAARDLGVAGEEVVATDWELARWAGGVREGEGSVGQTGWQDPSLVAARKIYVDSKAPIGPSSSPPDPNSMDVDPDDPTGQRQQQLEGELLNSAVSMTMRAMQTASSLMDQLLPASSPSAAKGPFHLVHREAGGGGGMREWEETVEALSANAGGDRAKAAVDSTGPQADRQPAAGNGTIIV